MPTYRDEAVVLRTHKLGEADRIVTMLSRRHGKIRAVAKGVRRTGSRFGARLEPFMVIDGQFYVGRTLDIVQQAESAGSYGAPGPHTAFVPQLGGVVADAVAPPGAVRLDTATLSLLGALLAGDWDAAEDSDDRTRDQASGVAAAYTQYHLERGLRSLELQAR
jgi:recombinational DNA repair protein (RecF pathway)